MAGMHQASAGIVNRSLRLASPGFHEEVETFFLDSSLPAECEDAGEMEHAEEEADSEGTRADSTSHQGDSETISSDNEVEDFLSSASESEDSVVDEDLLETAPAVGTRVEVYFTDGSWVPAVVTRARGMQAHVTWDTNENMEVLRDQCLLDFREDVVRLAVGGELPSDCGGDDDEAQHVE
ncbi:unnamed protein product [Symbiodinium natans]|uniref:Tudor domain-containing protein n=1 Tax=Symbiodinium natans TaxID=878477 RepID=A0A812NQI9_9DINO|nr:unnamed protein product [Symbiodinium natans]